MKSHETLGQLKLWPRYSNARPLSSASQSKRSFPGRAAQQEPIFGKASRSQMSWLHSERSLDTVIKHWLRGEGGGNQDMAVFPSPVVWHKIIIPSGL